MKPIMRLILIGIALASLFLLLVVAHSPRPQHATSDATSIILSP